MIKQINISHMEKLEGLLEKALHEGYTHFVPYSNEIQIHQSMLKSIELPSTSFVVDYTIHNTYLNDCRYFGKTYINFEDWVQNINLYPNVIYEINSVLKILNKFEVETIFDLALFTILKGHVAVEGHVALDFKDSLRTSKVFWRSFDRNGLNYRDQFFLNKIAYEHQRRIPFTRVPFNDHDSIRYSDSVLLSTKFKAPRWLVNPIKNYSLRKHKEISYIYDKDDSKIKSHVVFLGFDYHYRGNSKYLFNYFVKHNATVESYFITDDRTGPHFISPNDESAKEVIETASVVIIESYLPDDVRPNGKVIQLWHGTPIKRLFLDSKEPHQNLNIYNYRARKYNKWVHQDYLVVDSTEVVKYFESAFPSHKLDILPIGYPRVNYLLNKSQDLTLRKRIIKGLQLDTSKPVLLYAPTWKSNTSEEDILPLSDKLLNKYNVIFKGHVESKDNYIPDGVIVPPESVETQDLIMIADIVLTDYSSIIFDALTLNKKVCLYTPNHAQYVEERGVYEDVLNSLKEVWYTDAELLTNHLISDSIPHVNSKYINRQNHSLDKLSHLIAQQIN